MVAHVPHDLADEVYAETAALAFHQGRREVGLRGIERIERESPVAVLHFYPFSGHPQTNTGGAGNSPAAAMQQRIHEQFLEHQVEVELDFIAEGVFEAKPGHSGCQPFQLGGAAVEGDFRLGQNFTIVA